MQASMSGSVPTGPCYIAKLLTAACRDSNAALLRDIDNLFQAYILPGVWGAEVISDAGRMGICSLHGFAAVRRWLLLGGFDFILAVRDFELIRRLWA
jgi:hypothetical protein